MKRAIALGIAVFGVIWLIRPEPEQNYRDRKGIRRE